MKVGVRVMVIDGRRRSTVTVEIVRRRKGGWMRDSERNEI